MTLPYLVGKGPLLGCIRMRATIASCLGVEDLSLHFSVERAIECSSPGGGLASCRMHSHFPERSINTVTADVDSLYAPHKREKLLPMHVWSAQSSTHVATVLRWVRPYVLQRIKRMQCPWLYTRTSVEGQSHATYVYPQVELS